MAGQTSTKLAVNSRSAEGSRAARRLRRSGQVPGVIYGGGEPPENFSVDWRTLRNTLAHAHAVIDLSVDGKGTVPAMVKDIHRHPVRDETVHIDLLRVRLDQTVQAEVTLELVGAEKAPGVVAGGVLSQEAHQVQIEALPTAIPDTITHDVSDLELNAVLALSAVKAPEGVRFLDDLETTVIATITPPSAEPAAPEVETETEVVGEKKESSESEEQGAAS